MCLKALPVLLGFYFFSMPLPGVCSRSRLLLQLVISIMSSCLSGFYPCSWFLVWESISFISLWYVKSLFPRQGFKATLFTQQSIRGLEFGISHIYHCRSWVTKPQESTVITKPCGPRWWSQHHTVNVIPLFSAWPFIKLSRG